MPFKSQAQRKKFAQLLVAGSAKLPKRVTTKAKKKAKRKATAKPRARSKRKD